MKRLVLAALLLASCATVAKPAPPTGPDYATAYAQAICDKNAKYLSQHSAGAIAGTEMDWHDLLAGFSYVCASVRYVTTVHGDAGDEFLFVFGSTDPGHELWFGVIFDAQHDAVSVE